MHWQEVSEALWNDDLGQMFSGSAVLDNGKPTMIYTGVAPPETDAEAIALPVVEGRGEAQDGVRLGFEDVARVVPGGPDDGVLLRLCDRR